MARAAWRTALAATVMGAISAGPVGGAPGRIVPAASLAQADVQRAVDAASDGDTVKLPAGTAIWSTGVNVAGRCITIAGAGVDKTVIVGGTYESSPSVPTHRMFTIDARAGGLTRLTALTLDGGQGARDEYNKGMVAISGASTTWRVDHLRIRATRTSGMHVYASGGVVDHCRFDLIGWTFGIYGFNGGGAYGDAAWAEDAGVGGGTKPFFVEDNVFAATDRSFALDGWCGERVVFRHNTLRNASIGNHGTETSGRLRGARSFEIYDNSFAFAGRTFYAAVELRSGTGTIFDNTVTGDVTEAFRVDNYRDFGSFAPWGIASGESPYDRNDVGGDGKPVVHDTGTHTGGTGAVPLRCEGKRWKPDQWRGYSVFNAATGKSSIIIASSADSLVTRVDDSHGGPNLTWHPGDTFRIERCLIALDQPGRGKGALLSHDTPQPSAWPDQALEPICVWGNRVNGQPRGLASGSPRLREGVDFVNGVRPPGYLPYPYPHPLAQPVGERGRSAPGQGILR